MGLPPVSAAAVSSFESSSSPNSHSKGAFCFPHLTSELTGFWEKIKARWRHPQEIEREIDLLLKKTPKELNEGWQIPQNDLLFTAVDHLVQKGGKTHNPLGTKTRTLLKKVLPKHIDGILKSATEKQKSKEFLFTLLDLIDSAKLETLLREDEKVKVQSLRELSEEISKNLPAQLEPLFAKKALLEVKRTASPIINFFPNLLNMLIQAFSLADVGRGPESIWDFMGMLDIYCKVFMVPHVVFLLVGAFTAVAWEAYLITAIVVALAVILLFIYIKWLRPCPSQIPNTRNLSHLASIGQLDPVIGRKEKINEVISAIGPRKEGMPVNVILVGPTGAGKTDIMNGVAQEFKGKKIFSIDTQGLLGGYLGYADKLEQILSWARGYEREVVFFFDEIHVAVNQSEGKKISEFLKPLFDRPGIQVVAATTSEGYEKQIRSEESFLRRFHKVEIPSATDSETRRILEEKVRAVNDHIVFTDSVVETIIQLTNDCNLPGAQPSRAVNVLNLAINRIKAFAPESFVPPKLKDKKDQLENLKLQFQNRMYPCIDRGANNNTTKETLEKQILDLEAKAEETRNRLVRAKKILANIAQWKKEMFQNARTVAEQKAGPAMNTLAKRVFYTRKFFLPASVKDLKKILKIDGSLDHAELDVPLLVNSDLIASIVDEMAN